jgi:integrase
VQHHFSRSKDILVFYHGSPYLMSKYGKKYGKGIMKPRLTASQIAKAKPGRHADGSGLYLFVSAAGSRSWVFRYRRDGRLRDFGLGSTSAVSLAEARDKAIDARRQLAAGIDPISKRESDRAEAKAEAARATTFGEFAKTFIDSKSPEWRNSKHSHQWRMTLLGIEPQGTPAKHDYCKSLRGLPVSAVDADAVLKVLTPIWQSRPETANRIRGRIESILDAAKVVGLRERENPARWKGGLKHILPTHSKRRTVKHRPALPHMQIADFVRALHERETSVAARCLEFLILTVVRPGNAVRARWSQIDREAKTWTIPANEMKGHEQHVVPLSDAALAVLDQMDGIRRGEFIFPSTMGTGAGAQRRTAHMSDAALATVIDRMNEEDRKWLDPASGREVVPHGFRSTFRNWGAETEAATEPVLEACLAHVVDDAVVAAYRRTKFDDRRRLVMSAWGAYVTATPGKVIPLRKPRG